MSIPASGALRRSGGVVSAIGKQVKLINLKAVNRITVTFDPFSENVKSTRYVNTAHLTSLQSVPAKFLTVQDNAGGATLAVRIYF